MNGPCFSALHRSAHFGAQHSPISLIGETTTGASQLPRPIQSSNVLGVVLTCLICAHGILSHTELHLDYSKPEHVLSGQLPIGTQETFPPPFPAPHRPSIQASAIVMKMLQSTWNDRSPRPRHASKNPSLPACVMNYHKSGKSRTASSKPPSCLHKNDPVVLSCSENR